MRFRPKFFNKRLKFHELGQMRLIFSDMNKTLTLNNNKVTKNISHSLIFINQPEVGQ